MMFSTIFLVSNFIKIGAEMIMADPIISRFTIPSKTPFITWKFFVTPA